MTNKEKNLLRQLVKEGYSFSEIKRYVDCSDQTIRRYIKVLRENKNDLFDNSENLLGGW